MAFLAETPLQFELPCAYESPLGFQTVATLRHATRRTVSSRQHQARVREARWRIRPARSAHTVWRARRETTMLDSGWLG